MDSWQAKVQVEIGGETYVLRGDSSEERLRALAEYVHAQIVQLQQAQPKLGPTRSAVLVALRLAEELTDLREQFERVSGMLEREWRRRLELEGQDVPRGGP